MQYALWRRTAYVGLWRQYFDPFSDMWAGIDVLAGKVKGMGHKHSAMACFQRHLFPFPQVVITFIGLS